MSEKLIIEGEATPIAEALRTERCETCRCGYFAAGAEDMGQCRNGPPTNLIIPLPPRMAGGAIQSTNFSGWPLVRRDQWCVTGYVAKVTH